MAGKNWSFRILGETVLLVRADDVDKNEKRPRLPPIEAAWAIESIPVGVPVTDATVRADLSRALEHAEGSVGRASQLSLSELRSAVAEAVRDERLLAFRTSRPLRIARDAPVEVMGPQEDSTTWIEIQLLDEETKEPVADERYVVETADGRLIKGRTNAAGKAREEGLVSGACKVSFPDLPDATWSPA